MANTRQGQFPVSDTGEDSHIGLAAVGLYPPNGYGLYDMAGNVWQWVSDWYRADYYGQLAWVGRVVRNPRGPSSSFDPDEPAQPKRVMRGGSYLCHASYCNRYRTDARSSNTPDSATTNLGFRCARDV